ncbi:hypothetical protein HG471_000655 [Candidatus Saccharibacteria bacterium]|jgi:hypothetical protein|nr:hypothetical protein [Candidatus Saccharibacteria bacterium]
MVEKIDIDIMGLDWIRELMQKMHGLGYSGLDLVISLGCIGIFWKGTSAKNARVDRVIFWVMLEREEGYVKMWLWHILESLRQVPVRLVYKFAIKSMARL